MLEYTKTIIQKVSFSKFLLQKELGKAMNWLNHQEKEELTQWIRVNFDHLLDEQSNQIKQEVNY